MFKIVAIVIVVAIAGVLLFAATRPDTFQVQRTATIQAPPEKIFPLINDFNRWNALSRQARARCMPGTATKMSVREAWKSPSRRHRRGSRSG